MSPRTKQWDTCAPEVILTEAGGRITDLFGYPLNYNVPDVQNRNGLVASNGVSHDQIIETLAPLLNEFGRKRSLRRMTRRKPFLTYFMPLRHTAAAARRTQLLERTSHVDSTVGAIVQNDLNAFNVAVDEELREQEERLPASAHDARSAADRLRQRAERRLRRKDCT